MPGFQDPFSGLKHDRKLTKNELIRAIRFSIAAEYEAIQLYNQLSESIEDELSIRVLNDIADEEKEHVGEFLKLLEILDPEEKDWYEKGKKEVEEMKFASTAKALQHLANITGKKIKIAIEEDTEDDIEDGDYVLEDSGPLGTKTTVSIKGEKFLGEFDTEDDALKFIEKDMKKSSYYPNVWFVSDHGNVIGPLDVKTGREIKVSKSKTASDDAFMVHNTSNSKTYFVKSSKDAKDSIDKKAIELAEEDGETIQMGKITVIPKFYWGRGDELNFEEYGFDKVFRF